MKNTPSSTKKSGKAPTWQKIFYSPLAKNQLDVLCRTNAEELKQFSAMMASSKDSSPRRSYSLFVTKKRQRPGVVNNKTSRVPMIRKNPNGNFQTIIRRGGRVFQSPQPQGSRTGALGNLQKGLCPRPMSKNEMLFLLSASKQSNDSGPFCRAAPSTLSLTGSKKTQERVSRSRMLVPTSRERGSNEEGLGRNLEMNYCKNSCTKEMKLWLC